MRRTCASGRCVHIPTNGGPSSGSTPFFGMSERASPRDSDTWNVWPLPCSLLVAHDCSQPKLPNPKLCDGVQGQLVAFGSAWNAAHDASS